MSSDLKRSRNTSEAEDANEKNPLLSPIVERMRTDWPKPSDTTSDPHALEALLRTHHVAHDNSKIEWWYLNGHIDEMKVSFFAAFFKLWPDQADPQRPAAPVYALNWAIIDAEEGKYYPFSSLDQGAPSLIKQLIDLNLVEGHEYIVKALRELVAAGSVPLPDTIDPSSFSIDGNTLKFGESALRCIPSDSSKQGDISTFELHLKGYLPGSNALEVDQQHANIVELKATFTPTHGPVLHGRRGVVNVGREVDDMFYYFYPSCQLSNVRLSGSKRSSDPLPRCIGVLGESKSLAGRGWIDHEFGQGIANSADEFAALFGSSGKPKGLKGTAWQWAAVQLGDGQTLTVTTLRDSTNRATVIERFAIVIESDGSFSRLDRNEVKFEAESLKSEEHGGTWKSTATGAAFPTRWRVTLSPANGDVLDLVLEAPFPDQEFITLAATPSFWEGYVDVAGTRKNGSVSSPVQGRGLVECHGEVDLKTIGEAVQMLHDKIVEPASSAASATVETAPDAPSALAIATATAKGVVSAIASLIQQLNPEEAAAFTEPHQQLFASLAALWALRRSKFSGDVQYAAEVEALWKKHLPAIRNDFRRVLLRSFVLRESDNLCELPNDKPSKTATSPSPKVTTPVIPNEKVAPSSSIVNIRSLTDEELYRLPSDAELQKPADAASVAVAQNLFTGFWRKDWRVSERLNALLAAEGVNMMLRNITDRLVPTMRTTVKPSVVRSEVKTSVSNIVALDSIDGTEYQWDSSGRGLMTSRSCLLFGGQVLYTRSSLPEGRGEPGVWEHKFTHVEQCEMPDDPTAAPAVDGDSICTRKVMVQRTIYSTHVVDCYFNREKLPDDSDSD